MPTLKLCPAAAVSEAAAEEAAALDATEEAVLPPQPVRARAEAAVAAAEDGDRQISPKHPETPNDYHPRQNYSGGWSYCPRTIQNYLTI